MGKYLHYFQNENDYNTVRENNYVEPWVSATHIQTSYRVDYNKSEDEKLLGTPLTFEILGSGNITWNLSSEDTGITTGYTIEYKKNDGEWTEITASKGGTEISVNNGDIVQFRGDNPTYYNMDDDCYAFFCSTCQFKAKANIMSLIDSTDFSTDITLQSAGTFSGLFSCIGLTDVGDLLLPATTLAEGCYEYMFEGCTNLTDVSNLVLPATTLANGCYCGMFYGCTSLTTTPELPATTLADWCYASMFADCTSLTTAPELPATTLTEQCYNSMFFGCTGLTTAPELPATTLAEQCYNSMFLNCTSLTTAPELPATTLAEQCYNSMFQGCTSLTTAPELPATTLAIACYSFMFNGCTNLNYIKCLATNISASDCTVIWVSGVASSGTFVKNANMSSWTTGTSGIPNNWTVQDA